MITSAPDGKDGSAALTPRSCAGLVLAVVTLLVAACSPSTETDADETPAASSTSEVPHLVDSADLALPIDPYLLDADEQGIVDQAFVALVNTCSRRFGLDVQLPAPASAPVGRTERRYGLTDAELAATSGYHLPGESQEPPSDQPTTSPDEDLVMSGQLPSGQPATEFAGQPLPEGGCAGEAVDTLGGDLGSAEAAQNIDVDSVTRAMDDQRVVDAFAAWSACMTERGHDGYDNPWDPPNDARFSGPTASADEVAVATADVECKDETNVVGVWFTVDAELQTAMIDDRRDELRRVEAAKSDRLQAARSALGDS